MSKKEEIKHLLHELNTPKSDLMRILYKLELLSKTKAKKLDKTICKLEKLQQTNLK